MKFVIQWIGGSLANRDLVFARMGDVELNNLHELILQASCLEIGRMCKLLFEYLTRRANNVSLFEFILMNLH